MANQPLTREQAQEVVDIFNQCLADGFKLAGKPSAKQEAARRMGIPVGTYRTRLSRAEELYDIKPNSSIQSDKTPVDVATARRLQSEVSDLRGQLKKTQTALDNAEDVRKAAFGLASDPLEAPNWTIHPKKKSKTDVLVPMLFASDFQWGEVVRADELNGINEYNVHIAKQRYRKMIEKTVELCFQHTVSPNYPGIIYLRGGDMISGGIHDELAETDAMKPNPAIKSLATEEARGIELLREHFGKVHVISVPGNHGRTTKKPRAKEYVDTNTEDLLSWYLELYFDNDKNVTFCTPQSGEAYFQVFDWWFCLTHGDRIGTSGGRGFVGPAATIMRGIQLVRRRYHTMKKRLDYVLIGHFHQYMHLPSCVVNGSLVGYSEYAQRLQIEPSPAIQTLLKVNPAHGLTESLPIFLSEVESYAPNATWDIFTGES